MSERTSIGWTDHTFNPWWGCVRVSPGCENCYAETWARRTGHDVWGPASTTGRRFFGDAHWAKPEAWNRKAEAAGEPARVFCASMADVFEVHPELDEPRRRLFDLIDRTPWLDWQLLTKRPENVLPMTAARWPTLPRNVWIGASVEDQRRWDERAEAILSIPAVVRFLSIEPLLGPIDLGLYGTVPRSWGLGYRLIGSRVSWAIVGGESGPGARTMDLLWANEIVRQLGDYGVRTFVKQLGSAYGKKGDAKAENVESFPAGFFRVREFPDSWDRRELRS